MDDAGRPRGWAETRAAALLQIEERGLPFRPFDDLDPLAFDQPFGEARRLPRERLGGEGRCEQTGGDETTIRPRVDRLAGGSGLIEGHAMDDQTAVARFLPHTRGAVPPVGDDVHGFARGSQKGANLADVGANPARRVGGRRVFTTNKEVRQDPTKPLVAPAAFSSHVQTPLPLKRLVELGLVR